MRIKTTTEYSTNWATIKAAVDKGRAREVLHSGDQIFITLKNGEDVSFDVTYDATGKLFLVMHDCMNQEHYMNELWTNAGGWRDCDMRRYLNEKVFDLLPDDLQSCIKPTTITQVIDGETVTCEDKLFLLSRTQVFGDGYWSAKEPEDSQLDIFKTERDRVKLCGDRGTWFWWLRSAYSTNGFYRVGSSGYSGSGGADGSGGVVLGFCI